MLIDVDENDASRTSARERLFHILYPPRLPRLRDDLYLALGAQRTIRIHRVVTSHNLRSRYERHFLGVTRYICGGVKGRRAVA